MEEQVQRFMKLLRYVDCVRKERVKIQSFLRFIPISYKDRINFSNPQTLEDTI